jgi:hypothetical protein
MLSDEIVRIESLGLTMQLVVDTTATVSEVGGSIEARIVPRDQTFLITIGSVSGEKVDASVAAAADRILERYALATAVRDASSGKKLGSAAKLLGRVPELKIAGSETSGHRFYVELPSSGSASPTIEGYTLFMPMEGQLIVLTLTCSKDHYEIARRAFELMTATLRIEDPMRIVAARRDAVLAGDAMLRGLRPEDYAAAMGASADAERWYRIFRPGATTAEGTVLEDLEQGYQRVEFWNGRRSEVAGRAETPLPDTPDNPPGYLVRVTLRLIERTSPSAFRIIDSDSTSFMSADRAQEAWSVRTIVREPGSERPGVWTETGARTGNTLSISINAPGRPPRELRPMIQGPGYINQFEVQVLPRLLTRLRLGTEVGFYAWRSDTETIALRRDDARPDPLDEKVWRISTRLREEFQPQDGRYDAEGNLIRMEMPTGSVRVPITPEALRELWKQRGLPTSTDQPDAASPGGGNRGGARPGTKR